MFRKAAKTMLVTTLTTSIAFLATSLSEIMPIKTFGYFATLLVLCNYVLILTNLPAIIIFREKRNMRKLAKNTGGLPL